MPRINNSLQPPSPASDVNTLEPAALPPDSSQAQSQPPAAGPAMIPSVATPDTQPHPDNTESSKGTQRRTLVGWFSSTMKRRGHNRMPRQEVSPQTSTPRTKTAPSNEQYSTMSPGQRVKVSVLLVDRYGYLTGRLSARLPSLLSDRRLVHASTRLRISSLTQLWFTEEESCPKTCCVERASQDHPALGRRGCQLECS